MKAMILPILVVLAGCATTPAPVQDPSLFHYIRSNRDGTLPEHIVHFMPDPSRIAVYKWVGKCETAAYVTADFDPLAGEPIALDAGKVARDGSQAKFGRIVLDQAARALDLEVVLGGQRMTERVEGLGRPWLLYDYDLADLNAFFQARSPKADFAFWWALIWPDPETGRMVSKPGWVDARHVGLVTRKGRQVRQFDLALRSDPDVQGHVFVDPASSHIIAADFDRPNHDNYRDFALELDRVEQGGKAAWDRLLASHYADCPKTD